MRTAGEPQSVRRGLPLGALRAFEAAARLRSLRDAAREIGLSPSAVSHHVRNLEAALGLKLFQRLAHGVSLTDAGRALADELSPAFQAITLAYAKAGAAPLQIRLSAAPLFASRYILPDIAGLNVLRPGVAFTLESTLDRSDVSADPLSMALSFGPQPKGVRAIEVAGSPSLVVAAPQVAATIGGAPEDLAGANFLTIAGRSALWRPFFRHLALEGPRREVYFDSIQGVLQAAEAGVGVALLPRLVCEEPLSAGRLRQVHPAVLEGAWRYWLAAAPAGPAARHLTAVARWLQARIGQAS